MKKLILIVLALLVAVPALAATPKWSRTSIGNGSAASMNLLVGDTGQTTTHLAVTGVSAVVVTFDPDITAATDGATDLQLLACSNSTQLLGQCQFIVQFATTYTQAQIILLPEQYIGVQVDVGPAGAQKAKLTVMGAMISAGGEGTATAPGILNSRATEITLSYFRTLKHAEFLPGYPVRYFSSGSQDPVCAAAMAGGDGGWPTGDDITGDGSKATPYRSIGRMFNITSRGIDGVVGGTENLVFAQFDPCDTWATHVVGGKGDLECQAPGCSTPYLISSVGGVREVIWQNTDFAGCAGFDDELCFAVLGGEPSGIYKAKFDFTSLTDVPPQYFFKFFNNPTQGWVHFEGFQYGTLAQPYPDGCATNGDLFRVELNGRLSVVNVEAYLCAPGGLQNELWTTHWSAGATPSDVNYSIFMNGITHYPNIAADEGVTPFQSIGQSALFVIGHFTDHNTVSAAPGQEKLCVQLMAGVGDSNYAFLYGYECQGASDGVTTNTTPFAITGTDNEATQQRMFIARSFAKNWFTATGAVGGFLRPNFGAVAVKNTSFTGYRNSSLNNAGYIAGPQAMLPLTEFIAKDYCSAHFKGAGGVQHLYKNTNNGSACDLVDLVFMGTSAINGGTQGTACGAAVFDGVICIDNRNYNSVANAAIAAATPIQVGPPQQESCNDLGSPNPNRWGGTNPDSFFPTLLAGDPFGGATTGFVPPATPQFTACDIGSLNEDFLFGAYIPSYLAGEPLIGAIMNHTGQVDLPLGW